MGVLYSMSDNVNHPPHYNRGVIETIDIIKNSMSSSEFEGYLQGNVIKYICRYRYKGTSLEDLQKAEWYIKKLIEEVEDFVDAKPSDSE
tara:strand:+ start:839 stop:1105 length:267 start_codon:yes stop_codon:yes gene_type:complete